MIDFLYDGEREFVLIDLKVVYCIIFVFEYFEVME